MFKKVLGGVLLSLVIASSVQAQRSDPYPNRPIKLVVGFAPGGGTDILARYYAGRLSEKLGQQVVVENRPGAGSNLAMELVAAAEPDGYTLIMAANSLTVNHAFGKNKYDWRRDFTPITLTAEGLNVLVVPSKSSIATLGDLIAEGKKRTLTFGSAGVGSSMHMTAELFKDMVGIQMEHVPYKGQAPAELDLVAGHIDMMFDNIAGATPLIRSGKLRALGVAALNRADQLPEVPTIDELGVKGFENSTFWILMAAGKIPENALGKLAKAAEEIAGEEQTRAAIKGMNLSALGGGPRVAAERLAGEQAKWDRAAAKGTIKLQ